ncbi:hypothetical protein QE152_g27749 [Popillia japonica]|uniref:Uncharacterized protein n=1 Tax=Popillia japonica TaxID=7064 RepID=A0AAW1JNM1_POPJA
MPKRIDQTPNTVSAVATRMVKQKQTTMGVGGEEERCRFDPRNLPKTATEVFLWDGGEVPFRPAQFAQNGNRGISLGRDATWTTDLAEMGDNGAEREEMRWRRRRCVCKIEGNLIWQRLR